ncbi:MAG TPA: hypothetical protein VHQ47_00020, partial [Phycisphaerae bacterium]|nr:hypothetical protein [Phycisphaerae bacterium]
MIRLPKPLILAALAAAVAPSGCQTYNPPPYNSPYSQLYPPQNSQPPVYATPPYYNSQNPSVPLYGGGSTPQYLPAPEHPNQPYAPAQPYTPEQPYTPGPSADIAPESQSPTYFYPANPDYGIQPPYYSN